MAAEANEQPGKSDAAASKEGVLYLGIDLGTSRTSIAASNGLRETVESVVGYPRDVVARKLLKKEKLFGTEAREKRLSLDFFRPLQHGSIKFSDGASAKADFEKNLTAVKDLVQYAVGLAKPRKDELIYGVIGAPAQASIKNKKYIVDAAREVLDSVMLCSEPFAVAYGKDLLDDVLVIDIGAGTVDLCRMHGTMPEAEDQITLTTAGDWLDDELFGLLKAKAPTADFNANMVKEIKEKNAFVTESSETVRVELPVNGKPTLFDVTDEIRKGCRRIIPPIVESLHKLIATFDPEFQAKLRSNVLLAGGGSQIIGLGGAIEQEMKEKLGGGRVKTIEEPVYAGANGALKIAHDMPEEYWEKLK